MCVARKGGGEQAGDSTEQEESYTFDEGEAEEQAKKKQKKSTTIVTIDPHLNIVGCTHPQHQHRLSVAEEQDPIGHLTRQS